MAQTLLQRIKESLAKEGINPRTAKARDWLRNKIKSLNPTAKILFQDTRKTKNNTILGKMYFYYYDPKTKDKLSFYDKFPLVIPIEQYSDGFLGLNLHYIHPRERIILLDKLSETLNNSRYDEKTKFRISYEYLKAAKKMYEAKPCLKRYLFANIQSKFLEISADEWDIAVLLPVENFVGASKTKVFLESREKF